MHCNYKNEEGIVNGIMCGKSGNYCATDQWCETISCGNDIISPKCSLCPKAYDTGLNGWCGGHCEVDKSTGDCKEGWLF